MARRCKGITRLGYQCGLKTNHPSGYCKKHLIKEGDTMRSKVDETKEKIKEAVTKSGEYLENFIREEPIKATILAGVIGLGLGIGFGMLINKKK